ncbi:MAG: penicillin-binding transpeptidase domain-containing protein, partial [Acidimicrobiia bacterium]
WRGEFDEDLIQQWARQLGFDAVTGVDLPFEQRGLIPDRDWFERTQHETPGRVREGPWVGGDVMNVVIGQGEVVVTPLQLANAYAALANGGTLWQPHVVDRVIDQNGNVLFINEPQVIRELTLDPATVALFRQDLKLVVNGRSGTARSAFKGFGESRDEVGGKTGTAEIVKGATRAEDIDTALFVGVVPVDNPKYVVAVVIERGGSGGRIAAPTARRVLQYLMGEDLTDVAPGADTD